MGIIVVTKWLARKFTNVRLAYYFHGRLYKQALWSISHIQIVS